MNLRFFIDRPVFSGVISVVIVLLGMISMFSLPVEQYPDIAPPTINVFATYPGYPNYRKNTGKHCLYHHYNFDSGYSRDNPVRNHQHNH